MLGIDRIQRELKVIARIDEMFWHKKYHSPSDLIRFQSRQSRRKELLEMKQQGAILGPTSLSHKKSNILLT